MEKFIGDAVMAVFGAPVAHGDDAERAVRAGLRVLAQVEAHGLSARAAVNTGEAVVRLTEQASGEAIAMGDVVNTASRLQSHAPTGRLIVGDATYRSTRQTIRYEPHDAVTAKGKAEPLAAWVAVEVLPRVEGDVPSAAAFVGRGRELELVRSVWNQAVSDRRPHVVTVLGSPGVGKSRLCREVAALVAADGGQILRGRCLPYEETTGYHAFSQLVRQVAGIFDSDAPASPGKARLAVESHFPPDEAPSRLRDLALLLGLGADEHPFEQGVLFFSARRLLERLGEERPTLVVVEDVHWAATSELDLFEYLGAHVRETRVLFIALARPELLDARPTWGVGSGAQARISLEPLPAQVAAEMAVGCCPMPTPRPIERLVEVAEGNPLFIEELAAATVEQGGVEELPVTVRAVIAARIDALPPDARNALLSAAVIGRTFWQDVLRAVAGSTTSPGARRPRAARPHPARADEPARGGRRVPVQARAHPGRCLRHAPAGNPAGAACRDRPIRRGADGRCGDRRLGPRTSLARSGRAGEGDPAPPRGAVIAQQSWATGRRHDLYSQALELAGDETAKCRSGSAARYSLIVLNEYQAALDDLEAILPELEGSGLLDALLTRERRTCGPSRTGR